MEVKPVTQWVALLKNGDAEAAQNLWQEYFVRLVRLAKDRIHTSGVDNEVVAASAFNSFCMAAMNGRFPQLGDRDDLWRLLISITQKKIARHLRQANAQKRGGEVSFENGEMLDGVACPEPTPQFAAAMIDEFEHMLGKLPNENLRQIAVWKMEGFTHEEIAAKLSCAKRTVAYKLELIRKLLESEGDHD